MLELHLGVHSIEHGAPCSKVALEVKRHMEGTSKATGRANGAGRPYGGLRHLPRGLGHIGKWGCLHGTSDRGPGAKGTWRARRRHLEGQMGLGALMGGCATCQGAWGTSRNGAACLIHPHSTYALAPK